MTQPNPTELIPHNGSRPDHIGEDELVQVYSNKAKKWAAIARASLWCWDADSRFRLAIHAFSDEQILAVVEARDLGWQDIETAPKGLPSDSVGCPEQSEWFLGKISDRYYRYGARIVVIRRRAWPQNDGWTDNYETDYAPDYFEAWRHLPAIHNEFNGEKG